jgi:excisionase family DNA binding protein
MSDAQRADSVNPAVAPTLVPVETSPWLTVAQAADRARCGRKLIYREVRSGRLRAARIGGRRDLRFRIDWVDVWLDQASARSLVVDGAR